MIFFFKDFVMSNSNKNVLYWLLEKHQLKVGSFFEISRRVSQLTFDLCSPEEEDSLLRLDILTFWLRCLVITMWMWTALLMTPSCNLSWTRILTCVGLDLINMQLASLHSLVFSTHYEIKKIES